MNENEKNEPTAEELLDSVMSEIAEAAEDEVDDIYDTVEPEDDKEGGEDTDPEDEGDDNAKSEDTDPEDEGDDNAESEDTDPEDEGDDNAESKDTDPEDGKEQEKPDDGDSATDKEPEEDKKSQLLEQVKQTLKALGAKNGTDDEMIEELQKLAADVKGVPLEKYKAELQKEEADKAAKEAIYKRDLDAIHTAYPTTSKYTHIKDIPNAGRFIKLMATGEMSAVEAFKIANPGIADEVIAKGVKRASLNGTKSHITSSVPKQNAVGEISSREMKEYRELFPDLTDKQIMNLYKSTK